MAEQLQKQTGLRHKLSESGEIPMPSFRDVVSVIFRHKWVILVTFSLISAAGVSFSLLSDNIYESEGSLLLKAERGDLSIDPSSTKGIMGTSTVRNSPENEISILKSPILAEEVAAAVGPDLIMVYESKARTQAAPGETPKWSPDEVQSAANLLLKSLETGTNMSDILWLRYRHPNPMTARLVVQSLMDRYIERHIQIHSSSASPEFFQAKSEEALKQIQEKEKELERYQTAHSVGSIADQKAELLARVAASGDALQKARVDIDASKARIDALERVISGTGQEASALPAVIENPALTPLKARMSELKLEKLTIEARFTASSKEVRTVNEEISQLGEQMRGIPATVPRPMATGAADGSGADPAILLENERVNYQVLTSTELFQAKALEEAKGELKKLEAIEAPVLVLTNELAGLKANFEDYSSAVRKAEFSAELDRSAVSNVKIVQAATQPIKPVAPRRVRNIAMTLFFGVIAGVGLAFVREFFDDTIKSREEMEKKLGLTVLAVVPVEEFRQCT